MDSGAQITISVEGASREDAEAALGTLPAAEVAPVGPDRAVGEFVSKALKWIVKTAAGSAEFTEKLTQAATNQLAGATVTVRVGSTTVEVTNANRAQVLDVLREAARTAREADEL